MLKSSSSVFALMFLYFSLVIVGKVNAGGMEVEPGMWETKTQITSPGGTQDRVSQDCIKESEFSPETMMDDSSGCTVTDSKADASSMQWTLSCENQGIQMTGSGHAESSGNSITGGMDINADFNGQKMTMVTKWEGKRIGDCK